ncbi:hypothetical protein EXIGLDRAFT_236887 [Exidia glandulosa HHB12029]|uniref:Uncharacterized protein n=1 Tax=Exidia glandulosa HHB12029 TaxID=1314781 RepID=A0A165E148_EXIGL|nr:hypothetical protein EXIGLDRAFT_236887 [Exidia glandulosa HHB12029]
MMPLPHGTSVDVLRIAYPFTSPTPCSTEGCSRYMSVDCGRSLCVSASSSSPTPTLWSSSTRKNTETDTHTSTSISSSTQPGYETIAWSEVQRSTFSAEQRVLPADELAFCGAKVEGPSAAARTIVSGDSIEQE